VSPTLTRRDRVALGAVQGGALYYGATRRWPEPAIGIFEPYATHPGPTTPPARPPSDIDGHSIKGFIVSDLDGTPKLYSGYGSSVKNVAPVHIWPMNLNGTFGPSPAHTMNTFGMTHYLYTEGKLWCFGDQGPTDFCTGSPGGTWVDGICHPETTPGSGGFVHAHHLVRHGGYTWISGQKRVTGNTGAVWRCTDPTGSDGQYVWGDSAGLEVYHPTGLFTYQGKLWMQPAADFPGSPPPDAAPPLPAYANHKLCYWDETAHTFVPTSLEFLVGSGSIAVPWKTVMLVAGAAKVHSFNGTSITTVYSPPGGDAGPPIGHIQVTPDDTVWIMDGFGVGRSSTDLVTWTKRFQAEFVSTQTFTVYGDYAYIGDKNDHIWRTKVIA
jgi:hypothetical protein